MPLQFRDFFPALQDTSLLFGDTYDTLEETMARVNEWLATAGVRVVSVETVVLPNVDGAENGSRTAVIRTSGDFASRWFQVVRVWFQDHDAQPA